MAGTTASASLRVTMDGSGVSEGLEKWQKDLGLVRDAQGRLFTSTGAWVDGLSKSQVQMGLQRDSLGHLRNAQFEIVDGLKAWEIRAGFMVDALGNVTNKTGDLVRVGKEQIEVDKERAARLDELARLERVHAEQIEKTAQQYAHTVVDINRFRDAADGSGVSSEKMVNAIQRISAIAALAGNSLDKLASSADSLDSGLSQRAESLKLFSTTIRDVGVNVGGASAIMASMGMQLGPWGAGIAAVITLTQSLGAEYAKQSALLDDIEKKMKSTSGFLTKYSGSAKNALSLEQKYNPDRHLSGLARVRKDIADIEKGIRSFESRIKIFEEDPTIASSETAKMRSDLKKMYAIRLEAIREHNMLVEKDRAERQQKQDQEEDAAIQKEKDLQKQRLEDAKKLTEALKAEDEKRAKRAQEESDHYLKVLQKRADETKRETEMKTVSGGGLSGPANAGSSEAYSIIAKAWLQSKDPVVAATEKTTEAINNFSERVVQKMDALNLLPELQATA